MSGHRFGDERPLPVEVESDSNLLSDQEWLRRDLVNRTIVDVTHDRSGMTLYLSDGESYLIESYLQKSNPQPIFVRNTKWGRLP